MANLKVKKYTGFFKLTNEFSYDLFKVLSPLAYARAASPCSKYRTFHEVLPNLYEGTGCLYDQLLDALSFIGANYQKFIEIFTEHTGQIYKTDTLRACFDCANLYFEIDREDDFRRKGFSKENHHFPIVGHSLLLDKNQIPAGMKMYPGNESEKPVLRDMVNYLKKRNNVTGRTIHMAAKGLSCTENIAVSTLISYCLHLMQEYLLYFGCLTWIIVVYPPNHTAIFGWVIIKNLFLHPKTHFSHSFKYSLQESTISF